MDLIAACNAFVHVAVRGSFTGGAAAARAPQSVVSRRVQALEAHLGERLFDRTTRSAVLTPFGRDMLPAARRLTELADTMAQDAVLARLRPVTVAVPETSGTRELAELDAAARVDGLVLEFRPEAPAGRAALVSTRQVRAALVAVPPGDADWVVPLGVASASAADLPAGRVFRLEALRTARRQRVPRRLWLQPEDDVPHVRDLVERAGHRAGLLPSQVRPAQALTAAVSDVIRSTDLVLSSRAQANELGLHWRPLQDPLLSRGYSVSAAVNEDAQRFVTRWWAETARCLGSPPDSGGPVMDRRSLLGQ